MPKVILVHANCRNPTAKGDFSFAGNISKDMVKELQTNLIDDIDVILVSALDGVARFDSLYGPVVNGRVSIEGTDVGLSSLETFDAVENTVVAFIDANRCKHTAGDIVKRVLSPESKFMFVGNVNQDSYSSKFIQTLYRMELDKEQPGLYEPFSDEDMLIGSAGLGPDRLGIPTITKSEDLPSLIPSQSSMLPTGNYGFMYLAAVDSSKDYKLIAQYIRLSGHDQFVLVGSFESQQADIRSALMSETTLVSSQQDLPAIQYYQSLPNGVMRRMVANTAGSLVLSTGVTSALEAMRDQKLTYYQNMSNNTAFIAAYLVAVNSIVSNDTSLVGAMPQLIMDLSNLLFANKPLSKIDMERTHHLLEMSTVSSKLIATNQTIIDQAAGKIAPRLLSFLNGSRNTNDQVQLARVCVSLRKPGEMGSPIHDQALRRAACWGRLFELKVLIKSMSTTDLDKKDPNFERTALHWAAHTQNFDCARALVKAGASLDIQDKEGKTPLHKAIINADRQLIEMLIKAGASVNIQDNNSQSPEDCAPDEGILLFIKHCEAELIFLEM